MAGDAVRATLGTHWARLAGSLPAGERMLDIGSGTGVVGKLMLAARPDLAIDGVDSASIPACPGKGPVIHAGVAMEALPFPDACFGLAVSQFGFEYGDPHRAAPELARVLRPGAAFSFIVHHRESSIFAVNAMRRAALGEVFAGPLRAAFLKGDRVGLHQILRRLVSSHGDIDMIRELASVLPPRAVLDRHRRAAMWQALDSALAPEQVILDALLRAAQSPQSLAAWLTPLREAFTEVSAAPVLKPDGAPIAWHVWGMRP